MIFDGFWFPWYGDDPHCQSHAHHGWISPQNICNILLIEDQAHSRSVRIWRVLLKGILAAWMVIHNGVYRISRLNHPDIGGAGIVSISSKILSTYIFCTIILILLSFDHFVKYEWYHLTKNSNIQNGNFHNQLCFA